MSSLLRGSLLLRAGAMVGASALGIHTASRAMMRPIRCDAPAVGITPVAPTAYSQKPVPTGRFGGKLNYEELSIGSFTGLLCGYVVGKLSTLFAVLIATGLLAFQFVESRGYVRSPALLPLVGDAIQWGRRKLDVETLVVEHPSFKISYALSFLIAAFNA
uniref:ARAD1A03564p n=1 Tax=Blastobotrys adeninivorans TaxID=409370 RepID=A0A060T2V1_BLAAD